MISSRLTSAALRSVAKTGRPIGLRLAGRRHRRGSAAAQLFKMKLVHAAAVTLRNCNQVIIDFDLLALFRQVTKQMRDVATDGAHVRALQF